MSLTLMEFIMFAITILLFFAVVRQFKEGNKFGTAFSLVSFLVFLAVDGIIFMKLFS